MAPQLPISPKPEASRELLGQLHLPGIAPEVVLRLVVRDPEVVAELQRLTDGEERNRYALAALRLGVLALRVANGQVDSGAIKQAGEKLVSDMRELLAARAGEMTVQLAAAFAQYFDPASGVVPTRLHALVEKDGELERLLRSHLGPDESVLARTLASHLGEGSPIFRMLAPNEADGLRAHVERTLELALAEQQAQVLREFSLDRKESALSRLVLEIGTKQTELKDDLRGQVSAVMSEFSLDQPNSALSRVVRNLTLDDDTSALSRLRRELLGTVDELVRRNTDFQTDVRSTLAGLTARREEALRSTRHGVTFEQQLGEVLAREAQRVGDVCESVGASTGVIKNCKTGDFVLTLGPESQAPGAAIAWEAKEDRDYDVRRALTECEAARKNRRAQIGVFVFSRATAPPELAPFARYGDDLVVIWDADDPATDLHLKAAYSVARALLIRLSETSAQTAEALREIELSTRAVEKQLHHLDQIRTWAQTVQGHGEKIADRADRMRNDLLHEVERLDRWHRALRTASADEAEADAGKLLR